MTTILEVYDSIGKTTIFRMKPGVLKLIDPIVRYKGRDHLVLVHDGGSSE
jgi:hypothetical protein